jgi:hypothetical protein
LSDCKVGKHEAAPWVSEALSQSGDAEGLAGSSADKKVNCSKIPLLKFGHVPKVGNVRIVMFQHGRRERLDVTKGNGLPFQAVPSDRRRFDAGANG